MAVNVMDKILRRICSISNHPIAELDEKFRVMYIRGLGACLWNMSAGEVVTKMFFTAWAKSILQGLPFSSDVWKEDSEAIEDAISVHRNGFHFFSMKYPFFFDVFYLLSSGGEISIQSNESIYGFLLSKCGLFSKSSLKNVLNYFKEGVACPKIDSSLILHKELNDRFLKQQEKRILVVANVSAGKSTLINALIGHRLNQTKNMACTNKIVTLHNKVAKDGITVKLNDGGYTYFEDLGAVKSDEFFEASLPFSGSLEDCRICFVDTPGINNSEDVNHRQITEDAIKQNDYDAVIYISNCQYFGTYDEHGLLSMLKKETTKPMFFVLNHLDRFKKREDSIERMVDYYKTDLIKLGFRDPKIFPLSAHAALLMKLKDEEMDEEDQEEKIMYEKKFQQGYYNLPSYVGEGTFDPTGIGLLEQRLKEL